MFISFRDRREGGNFFFSKNWLELLMETDRCRVEHNDALAATVVNYDDLFSCFLPC